MSNEYYTPTIEEFYVGFEYEYLNTHLDIWETSNDFSNEYLYEDSPLYGVIKDLEEGNIRVKYLNKEDIESLGLKHLGSLWFKTELDDYRLRKWKNNELDIYRWYSNEDYQIIFRGTIKNKSELKVLLKQLGI